MLASQVLIDRPDGGRRLTGLARRKRSTGFVLYLFCFCTVYVLYLYCIYFVFVSYLYRICTVFVTYLYRTQSSSALICTDIHTVQQENARQTHQAGQPAWQTSEPRLVQVRTRKLCRPSGKVQQLNQQLNRRLVYRTYCTVPTIQTHDHTFPDHV